MRPSPRRPPSGTGRVLATSRLRPLAYPGRGLHPARVPWNHHLTTQWSFSSGNSGTQSGAKHKCLALESRFPEAPMSCTKYPCAWPLKFWFLFRETFLRLSLHFSQSLRPILHCYWFLMTLVTYFVVSGIASSATNSAGVVDKFHPTLLSPSWYFVLSSSNLLHSWDVWMSLSTMQQL